MKKFKHGGFKTPIWHALSGDHLRPVLEHAYIDDGFVVCTNAYILIKQSLKDFHEIDSDEVENLKGKFLHRDLLIQISKYDVIRFEKDGIRCIKDRITCMFEYSKFEGDFVNYNSVVSKFKSDQKTKINLDLKRLGLLSKAMGAKNEIELNFNEGHGYIKVLHPNYLGAHCFGLVMPIMPK